MHLVYIGWFTSLIGIFALLAGLNMAERSPEKRAQAGTIPHAGAEAAKTQSPENRAQEEVIPMLVNARSFLMRKLLMWIPWILLADFRRNSDDDRILCFRRGDGCALPTAHDKQCGADIDVLKI